MRSNPQDEEVMLPCAKCGVVRFEYPGVLGGIGIGVQLPPVPRDVLLGVVRGAGRVLAAWERALTPAPVEREWPYTPQVTPEFAAFIAEVERDGPYWEPSLSLTYRPLTERD